MNEAELTKILFEYLKGGASAINNPTGYSILAASAALFLIYLYKYTNDFIEPNLRQYGFKKREGFFKRVGNKIKGIFKRKKEKK